MYNDLPAGTTIVWFSDDALVVCTVDDIGILELRIHESLWWVMLGCMPDAECQVPRNGTGRNRVAACRRQVILHSSAECDGRTRSRSTLLQR